MKVFLPLSLAALVAPLALSQSTAQLRGAIADPQSAAIADAVVKLTNSQTGLVRRTVTNPSGEYQFLQLPPGAYALDAEKPGFATLSRSDVNLLVNTPTTLDLRMELGRTAESASVSAEASTVNTVDASVGNAFSERQVAALPLQTRNVVELLSLQPGVTTNGEVLGARRDQNNITLEGVDVNDNQSAGLVAQNTTIGTTYQGQRKRRQHQFGIQRRAGRSA